VIHPSGTPYEWIVPLVAKPPQAPLALTDLIGKTSAPKTAASADRAASGDRFWVADALRGVGRGTRDQMCTRLAGFFLKKGIDPDTVIALLCASFAPACAPPFDPREVEKCVRSIARKESIQGEGRAVRPVHISEVLTEFERALAAGPAPTLPTPFPTVNQILNGGLGSSDLIYLAARTSVGKTAFGEECARHAAKQQTGAVLVISREMTNLDSARRLIAQDARIRASSLKRADLNETERRTLEQSLARLRTLPLFFADEVVSLGEIQELVAAMAQETSLALLVVDYLQLVRAPKEIRERRHQVEAVSQGLKTLALQYRVPVLCLSSVSRGAPEDREDPPTLASLRESGELEHDADVILLLHRPTESTATKCRIAKNRDGRLGEVDLLFRAEFVAFDEASEQSETELFL
jgi:replicative DNA helicase